MTNYFRILTATKTQQHKTTKTQTKQLKMQQLPLLDTDLAKLSLDKLDSAYEHEFPKTVDFIARLPNEIAAYILSFVPSYKYISLVSRRWRSISTDTTVWRAHYLREFGKGQTVTRMIKRDWNSMYAVQMNLAKNWRNNKYVKRSFNGHMDSVYCIQFDDKKIVSGSRDRSVCCF